MEEGDTSMAVQDVTLSCGPNYQAQWIALEEECSPVRPPSQLLQKKKEIYEGIDSNLLHQSWMKDADLVATKVAQVSKAFVEGQCTLTQYTLAMTDSDILESPVQFPFHDSPSGSSAFEPSQHPLRDNINNSTLSQLPFPNMTMDSSRSQSAFLEAQPLVEQTDSDTSLTALSQYSLIESPVTNSLQSHLVLSDIKIDTADHNSMQGERLSSGKTEMENMLLMQTYASKSNSSTPLNTLSTSLPPTDEITCANGMRKINSLSTQSLNDSLSNKPYLTLDQTMHFQPNLTRISLGDSYLHKRPITSSTPSAKRLSDLCIQEFLSDTTDSESQPYSSARSDLQQEEKGPPSGEEIPYNGLIFQSSSRFSSPQNESTLNAKAGLKDYMSPDERVHLIRCSQVDVNVSMKERGTHQIDITQLSHGDTETILGQNRINENTFPESLIRELNEVLPKKVFNKSLVSHTTEFSKTDGIGSGKLNESFQWTQNQGASDEKNSSLSENSNPKKSEPLTTHSNMDQEEIHASVGVRVLEYEKLVNSLSEKSPSPCKISLSPNKFSHIDSVSYPDSCNANKLAFDTLNPHLDNESLPPLLNHVPGSIQNVESVINPKGKEFSNYTWNNHNSHFNDNTTDTISAMLTPSPRRNAAYLSSKNPVLDYSKRVGPNNLAFMKESDAAEAEISAINSNQTNIFGKGITTRGLHGLRPHSVCSTDILKEDQIECNTSTRSLSEDFTCNSKSQSKSNLSSLDCNVIAPVYSSKSSNTCNDNVLKDGLTLDKGLYSPHLIHNSDIVSNEDIGNVKELKNCKENNAFPIQDMSSHSSHKSDTSLGDENKLVIQNNNALWLTEMEDEDSESVESNLTDHVADLLRRTSHVGQIFSRESSSDDLRPIGVQTVGPLVNNAHGDNEVASSLTPFSLNSTGRDYAEQVTDFISHTGEQNRYSMSHIHDISSINTPNFNYIDPNTSSTTRGQTKRTLNAGQTYSNSIENKPDDSSGITSELDDDLESVSSNLTDHVAYLLKLKPRDGQILGIEPSSDDSRPASIQSVDTLTDQPIYCKNALRSKGRDLVSPQSIFSDASSYQNLPNSINPGYVTTNPKNPEASSHDIDFKSQLMYKKNPKPSENDANHAGHFLPTAAYQDKGYLYEDPARSITLGLGSGSTTRTNTPPPTFTETNFSKTNEGCHLNNNKKENRYNSHKAYQDNIDCLKPISFPSDTQVAKHIHHIFKPSGNIDPGSISSDCSSTTGSVNYDVIMNDLEEIQRGLAIQQKGELSLNPNDIASLASTSRRMSDASEEVSTKVTGSEVGTPKKFIWDYGDLNGEELSEFRFVTSRSDLKPPSGDSQHGQVIPNGNNPEKDDGVVTRNHIVVDKSNHSSKSGKYTRIARELEMETSPHMRLSKNTSSYTESPESYRHAEHFIPDIKGGKFRRGPQFDDESNGFSQKVHYLMETDSPQRQAYKYLMEAEDKMQILNDKRELRAHDNEYHASPSTSSKSSSFALTPIPKRPFHTYGNLTSFLTTQLDRMSNVAFDTSVELRSPLKRSMEKQIIATGTGSTDRDFEPPPCLGQDVPIHPEVPKVRDALEDYVPESRSVKMQDYVDGTYRRKLVIGHDLPNNHKRSSHRDGSNKDYELRTSSHLESLPENRLSRSSDKLNIILANNSIRSSGSHPDSIASQIIEDQLTPKSDSNRSVQTVVSPDTPVHTALSEGSLDRLDHSTGSRSSSNTNRNNLRPYRPRGGKVLYYVESTTDDGNVSISNSETTIESTHIGSDDFRPPKFPSHYLGSRKDPPKLTTGIYAISESKSFDDTKLHELNSSGEKTLTDQSSFIGVNRSYHNNRQHEDSTSSSDTGKTGRNTNKSSNPVLSAGGGSGHTPGESTGAAKGHTSFLDEDLDAERWQKYAHGMTESRYIAEYQHSVVRGSIESPLGSRLEKLSQHSLGAEQSSQASSGRRYSDSAYGTPNKRHIGKRSNSARAPSPLNSTFRDSDLAASTIDKEQFTIKDGRMSSRLQLYPAEDVHTMDESKFTTLIPDQENDDEKNRSKDDLSIWQHPTEKSTSEILTKLRRLQSSQSRDITPTSTSPTTNNYVIEDQDQQQYHPPSSLQRNKDSHNRDWSTTKSMKPEYQTTRQHDYIDPPSTRSLRSIIATQEIPHSESPMGRDRGYIDSPSTRSPRSMSPTTQTRQSESPIAQPPYQKSESNGEHVSGPPATGKLQSRQSLNEDVAKARVTALAYAAKYELEQRLQQKDKLTTDSQKDGRIEHLSVLSSSTESSKGDDNIEYENSENTQTNPPHIKQQHVDSSPKSSYMKLDKKEVQVKDRALPRENHYFHGDDRLLEEAEKIIRTSSHMVTNKTTQDVESSDIEFSPSPRRRDDLFTDSTIEPTTSTDITSSESNATIRSLMRQVGPNDPKHLRLHLKILYQKERLLQKLEAHERETKYKTRAKRVDARDDGTRKSQGRANKSKDRPNTDRASIDSIWPLSSTSGKNTSTPESSKSVNGTNLSPAFSVITPASKGDPTLEQLDNESSSTLVGDGQQQSLTLNTQDETQHSSINNKSNKICECCHKRKISSKSITPHKSESKSKSKSKQKMRLPSPSKTASRSRSSPKSPVKKIKHSQTHREIARETTLQPEDPHTYRKPQYIEVDVPISFTGTRSDRESPNKNNTIDDTLKENHPKVIEVHKRYKHFENARESHSPILRTIGTNIPTPMPTPSQSPSPSKSNMKMVSKAVQSSPQMNDDSTQISSSLMNVDHTQISVLAGSTGMAWYIPLPEQRPWRHPLRERQEYAASINNWPQRDLAWRERYALSGSWNRLTRTIGESETSWKDVRQRHDNDATHPAISLQDAFMERRKDFISASRERQKYLMLKSEERQIQDLHARQRVQLFHINQKIDPNMNSHPYSENLFHPKKRLMTKKEMKNRTNKMYVNLDEVKNRKEQASRDEQYRINRIRAQNYKCKILNRVLKKKAWVD